MHVFLLLFLLLLPFFACGPRGRWGWGAFLACLVAGLLVGGSCGGPVGMLGVALALASPFVGLLCWALAAESPRPRVPGRPGGYLS